MGLVGCAEDRGSVHTLPHTHLTGKCSREVPCSALKGETVPDSLPATPKCPPTLLFNMLSRLVITFLPRSKRLLISWLQSPSAVILELKKIKALTVSIVYPSICHEVMGLDAKILVF